MRLIVIVGLCLVGWWNAHAEAPALLPYKSAHWKQTVTIGAAAPGKLQKVEAELWFLKPDNMRVVTAVEGKRQVIVIKSGTALVFEEGSTTGMKMPLKQQMLDQLAQYTEVFSKLDTWKKAKTGEEKLGGKVCEIYGFSDKSGGQTTTGKVWLWTEKNFPMRMTLEAQGQSVTVEHSDVQVDEGLPLTMFDAPDNIKFVELPNTKKPLETSPVPRKITRPKVTMASGTGFFITEDGYLLTNYHVVEDAKRLEVRTGGQILPAKLFKCDYTNDIAVLKVCGTFPSLPIGSSSMVHLGDSVFTIGFPNISIQGIEPKFTRGEISSVAGIKDDPRWFQISVAVQPGNSGGPLIDQSGNVIGIIVARLDALRMLTETGSLPQNVNYAIKISLAAPLLEKVHEVSAKARISGATKRRVETIIENAKQAIVLVVSYP